MRLKLWLLFFSLTTLAAAEKPRIPETMVQDQDGRQLSFYSDLVKGHTVAINFIFTTCSTICPVLAANFRKTQQELGDNAAQVRLISISVDPATDTPERLKQFAGQYHAGPGWTLVTGDKAEIQALLGALGVAVRDKLEHTPTVLIGNDESGQWQRVSGLSSSSIILRTLREVEAGHGREIYRRGKVEGQSAGTAAIGPESLPMPSSSFACATCHGTWGEGSREGGIAAPPLTWKFLMSANPHRPAYTPETLRRAISAGYDPSGAPLDRSMPRFTMLSSQLTELIAYLKHLGDDDDTAPGVTSKSIRIGTALPLSGPLAPAGKSIRETLEALFAEASRNGGIYGRNLELVVEDSSGDAAGLLEATRRLIVEDHVFALVASFQTAAGPETGRLLETEEVPLVGPVALSPHEQGLPNAQVFYLLPSLYDQARAIVDFIAARDAPRRPHLAVIHAESAFDQSVVDGLRAQAALQGLEIVSEERDAPSAVAAALSKQPDYVVFSGDGPGLARVARELDQTSPAPVLAGFISTAESGVGQLPPRVAARALFAAPALPPDTRQASAFFSLLQAGNSPKTYLGLRTAAFAAGTVLLQALRLSGSRPDRDLLVRTLEHMQRFQTGVTAPLTFGPNQHVGSAGAVILALDPSGQDFVAVSDWIAPKIFGPDKKAGYANSENHSVTLSKFSAYISVYKGSRALADPIFIGAILEGEAEAP